MAVIVNILVLVIPIVNLVFFTMVVIKLFQEKGILHGILGIVLGIYTFIWGWMNASRLGIRKIMIYWSIGFVLSTVIAAFSFMISPTSLILQTLNGATFAALLFAALLFMSPIFLFSQILNGVTFAALLFLVASGFTLIFGLMRVANLTHGVLYLMAGYVGLTIVRQTGSFTLALIAAIIFAGILGFLVERLFLHWVQGSVLSEVLLTIGLAFILADVALMQWGGDPQTIRVPAFMGGPFKLSIEAWDFRFVYPRFRVVTLGLGVLVAAGLWFVQQKTRIGSIIRAGVDDAEMVSVLGINIPVVFTSVFVAGAMLAGFAGVIGGGFLSLYRGADSEILLFGLVVIIIGGMGSLPGAIIGSLLVGLIDSFGKALFPEISYFTIFGPMAIVLAIRPQGLFGRKN